MVLNGNRVWVLEYTIKSLNKMRDRFIEYIINCSQGIPILLDVILLVVFCVGVFFFFLEQGVIQGTRFSVRLLLIEYILWILSLTVLFRDVQVEKDSILIPFWSYRAIQKGFLNMLVQDVMNVAIFIPIGFLLGCSSFKMKWWKVALIGCAFSILIETLQFFLKRGIAEFDDVFHNVLGCMIGYGLYVTIVYIVRAFSPKRTIAPNNL